MKYSKHFIGYKALKVLPNDVFKAHIDHLMLLKKKNESGLMTALKPKDISNVYELVAVLRKTPPQQSTDVYQQLDQLNAIIKTAYDARYLMQMLSEEQQPLIYQAIKNHLLLLINDDKSLSAVLEYLSASQCKKIGDLLHHQLVIIIKDVHSLNVVLRDLTVDQKEALYLSIKDHVVLILQQCTNPVDLAQGLRNLTPNQCREVCISLKKHLGEIIKTTQQFKDTQFKTSNIDVSHNKRAVPFNDYQR